eukprot:943888-Prymnesium_polylepis.2
MTTPNPRAHARFRPDTPAGARRHVVARPLGCTQFHGVHLPDNRLLAGGCAGLLHGLLHVQRHS